MFRLKPQFWSAFVIFLGKMGYFAYSGVLFEMDSQTYLDLEMGFFHPPGYNIFVAVVLEVLGRLEAVVVVQSLLFSWAAGELLYSMFKERRVLWWATGMLALDPCTGQLCASILSEALFLAIGLWIFSRLPKLVEESEKEPLRWSLLLGAAGGMAYLVRFVSPLLMVVVLGVIWWPVIGGKVIGGNTMWGTAIRGKVIGETAIEGNRKHWKEVAKKSLKLSLGLLLAFQGVIFPLRLHCFLEYQSPTFNAFAPLSFWNSTAYLYPGSDVAQHPSNDFERHLQDYPDTTYALKSSLYTSHIFNPRMPFQGSVNSQQASPQEFLETARQARNTGLKLALEQPWRHFREMVVPNWVRPLRQSETIEVASMAPFLEERFGRKVGKLVRYDAWVWRGMLGVLVLGVGGLLWGKGMGFGSGSELGFGWGRGFEKEGARVRRSVRVQVGALAIFCLLYLVAISCLGVVFLRFLYALSPFIWILLCGSLSREQ